MENPHAEQQAVLLGRILNNVSKCTETLKELNHSLENIARQNSQVKIAADLSMKYRRNVQYNLEATSAKSSK
ncbi:unnamed protein product [Mycena citricolor]|uniref:DASH complex subunit DAD4 n=1 Tax=Mycena citricolor TaxID=2018698 RepID=A0AAD2HMK9_9AGAR|nr:unnamed protein product [Mycena citricolor]CAK5277594.1 unnamed protein product [Mycena citricolor]